MALPNTNNQTENIKRVRIWYALIVLIMIVFVGRLFYVQVIRYDYYRKAALNDQLKQYQIPASRGIIKAHYNDSVLPIVLNQQLYTLYADPIYIKDANTVAAKIVPIIGGQASDYTDLMKTSSTRYVVLAKKLTLDQKKSIVALKYPGLGTIAVDYRTYPQGTLASQELGFVNDEGSGEYGIEQALNLQLKGTPGLLRAITDVNGIPLAASKDNIQQAPKDGADIVLTLDLSMQQQLEAILAKWAKTTNAVGASALIMDPNTGAVKAMGNIPTYDPAKYFDVSDPSVFSNATVSQPIEVGSVMKTLTTSAALDQGVVKPSTTYYDPASWVVDGFRITNIEEDGGPGNRSLADLLNLSLNTGATWLLMQMGGGEINQKARDTWYNYLTNHFMLGKITGIEQGYESPGLIPKPKDNGAGINLTYANMAFGQGMTATPIQMASALSSVINGGTYYQPHLVDQILGSDGKITKVAPKVIEKHVVSPSVGAAIIPFMQYVVDHHYIVPPFDQSKYTVGGKTGTAEVAKPEGGYYDKVFNGTYLGFVGGDKVQYVIAVFVNKPVVKGYAGTGAAQPIFVDLARMLIGESYVTPKIGSN
jgi:cell division protein FtsI (penicillin-binding protein 3)